MQEAGATKAMCWVGLAVARLIGPVWIEGSMDQHVYLAARQGLWWMQDGETCHTARYNMEDLKEKFADHIISNESEQ